MTSSGDELMAFGGWSHVCGQQQTKTQTQTNFQFQVKDSQRFWKILCRNLKDNLEESRQIPENPEESQRISKNPKESPSRVQDFQFQVKDS